MIFNRFYPPYLLTARNFWLPGIFEFLSSCTVFNCWIPLTLAVPHPLIALNLSRPLTTINYWLSFNLLLPVALDKLLSINHSLTLTVDGLWRWAALTVDDYWTVTLLISDKQEITVVTELGKKVVMNEITEANLRGEKKVGEMSGVFIFDGH